MLFVWLTFGTVQNSFSQKFYFTAGGAYNFSNADVGTPNFCSGVLSYANNAPYYSGFSNLSPFAFADVNKSSSVVYFANGTSTFSNSNQELNQGLGSGLSFSVSAGYNITPNISAEIGFSYLLGMTINSSISNNSTTYNYSDTVYNNLSIASQLISSARYRITPSVKISASPAKFTPYLKAGLLVGFGGTITVTNGYTQTITTVEYGVPNAVPYSANTSLIASGGISFGFTGSAGVEYSIKDFLAIYCEVNKLQEKWSPVGADITEFNESVIPNEIVSSTHFTYSNSVSSSGSNTYNPNNYILNINSEYPQQKVSFSTWGIAIGVKLNLIRNKPAAVPANQN